MKNIAAVTLVAGVLGSTSGTQAGPGYDDYYHGGGYYGGYYAPYPPGPPYYLPFQFVKRPPLRRRSTTRHRSMEGSSYLLRLLQAAASIIIGLETTVQTRAMHRLTSAQSGEVRRLSDGAREAALQEL